MAISLPVSVEPNAVTWTRNRPRSISQSDFTGYTQQVLSGTTFLSGELGIPALVTTSQTRDWQKFFAELEQGGADGTFWVPIWSKDYDAEDSTGILWGDATIHSVAERTIRTEPGLRQFAVMENQIGRNVQVRSRADNDISLVYTLLEVTIVGDTGRYDLKFAEPLVFPAGYEVSVNTRLKVMARALLPDPETQTLVTDTLGGSAPTTVPWTEAVGHILQGLQSP